MDFTFYYPVLFRIFAPKRFIERFLASFTWRGSFNDLDPRKYQKAYETYSVHHKFYHDEMLNKGSKDNKQEALVLSLQNYDIHNQLHVAHFNDLCNIIFSYSEIYLGEISYFFHIDHYYILENCQYTPNNKKIGVAWNIKKIFQEIISENQDYAKTLKLNENFRISIAVIESWDRTHCIMEEANFFKFMKQKSDQFPPYTIFTNPSGFTDKEVHKLPIWNTPWMMYKFVPHYANVAVGQKYAEKDKKTLHPKLTKGNTFSNDEWIDCTNEIKCKLDVMKDNLFGKNKAVKLKGLKSKPQWNGMIGKIMDEYNFFKQRWVIKIHKPVNKNVLIKTCNLELLA
eukprot:479351_1